MGRLGTFRLAEGCLMYQGRCLMLWGLGNLVPTNQWMEALVDTSRRDAVNANRMRILR